MKHHNRCLFLLALGSLALPGCLETADRSDDAGPPPDRGIEVDLGDPIDFGADAVPDAAPDAAADAAPDLDAAPDPDARPDAAVLPPDRGVLPDQRVGPPPIFDAGLSGDLGPCPATPVITSDDQPTGLETCGPGHFDRVGGTCGPNVEDEHFEACTRDDDYGCRVDADCGDGQRCIETGWHCGCVTLCESDDDCGPDAYCRCRRNVHHPSVCYPTACRTADDCGGSPCGAEIDLCATMRGFHCRTPDDSCRTDDDCEGDAPAGDWECAWLVGEQRFGCRYNDAICE